MGEGGGERGVKRGRRRREGDLSACVSTGAVVMVIHATKSRLPIQSIDHLIGRRTSKCSAPFTAS